MNTLYPKSPEIEKDLVIKSCKTCQWGKTSHIECFYPCFSGDTEEDLKKNIDKYLEELMAAINEPLQECPTCEGVGVLKRDMRVAAK